MQLKDIVTHHHVPGTYRSVRKLSFLWLKPTSRTAADRQNSTVLVRHWSGSRYKRCFHGNLFQLCCYPLTVHLIEKMSLTKQRPADDFPLWVKFLTAGTAACLADLATFPLDTAKVRMQIAGETRPLLMASVDGSMLAVRNAQPGLWRTVGNIVRMEGARSLYGGLSAGLQRQMCFASIRLGLYDGVKSRYAGIIDGNNRSGSMNVSVRIAAGITTGAMAVLFAQPTDVVKVRLQAGGSSVRYSSTLQAYKNIAAQEGTRGLWKGTVPNISRNAIVNVAEIVCYDIIKDFILESGYLRDGIPCHVTAAVAAGLCTTLAASPVDVVKTRYMNSAPGEYKGVKDCAVRMFMKEGMSAFYKGFVPSFTRLVSWNIVLWITYEQFKIYARKMKDE